MRSRTNANCISLSSSLSIGPLVLTPDELIDHRKQKFSKAEIMLSGTKERIGHISKLETSRGSNVDVGSYTPIPTRLVMTDAMRTSSG
jgi:hypothetical protein